MTRRLLDRSRSRVAELIAPAGYHIVLDAALLNTVEAAIRERDAAYAAGFLEGIEAGLRQVLADAELALGRAA